MLGFLGRGGGGACKGVGNSIALKLKDVYRAEGIFQDNIMSQ